MPATVTIRIVGFVGADKIDGGAGTDTITLTGTSADLNAATDAQIVGVEAVSAAGASAGVTIDLHNQSDGFTITGSAFADTITGSSGADTIVGGSGGDTLTGGAGADIFAYKAIADLLAGAGNFDTIVDFTAGTDQLDLSAISGLTTFKIAGLTSASDAIPAHTIAWFYDAANNQTIVYGNNTASALNGGSAGLFEMHLAGVTLCWTDRLCSGSDLSCGGGRRRADLSRAYTPGRD